jgi:hypothetical protein
LIVIYIWIALAIGIALGIMLHGLLAREQKNKLAEESYNQRAVMYEWLRTYESSANPALVNKTRELLSRNAGKY